MEWLTDEDTDQAVRAVERQGQRRVVARRIGALLFVVVFLLDVFGDPLLVAQLSKLCGS